MLVFHLRKNGENVCTRRKAESVFDWFLTHPWSRATNKWRAEASAMNWKPGMEIALPHPDAEGNTYSVIALPDFEKTEEIVVPLSDTVHDVRVERPVTAYICVFVSNTHRKPSVHICNTSELAEDFVYDLYENLRHKRDLTLVRHRNNTFYFIDNSAQKLLGVLNIYERVIHGN
jgi:hypothetical protein